MKPIWDWLEAALETLSKWNSVVEEWGDVFSEKYPRIADSWGCLVGIAASVLVIAGTLLCLTLGVAK